MISDLDAAAELVGEADGKEGSDLLNESITQLEEMEEALSELEIKSLLGDEADSRNALV